MQLLVFLAVAGSVVILMWAQYRRGYSDGYEAGKK